MILNDWQIAERADTGVINHIFARINAADKALNPRNTKGDA
jgi:DNA mismatch repair ATPase MutS